MPFTTAPVITRAQLLRLKLEICETKREITLNDAERVDSFVNSIYRKVLDTAENSNETRLVNKIYNEYIQFYSEHLQEILSSLRQRLPDSKVESKVLVYGNDGKLQDSANLSCDSRMNTYILVDWSPENKN